MLHLKILPFFLDQSMDFGHQNYNIPKPRSDKEGGKTKEIPNISERIYSSDEDNLTHKLEEVINSLTK